MQTRTPHKLHLWIITCYNGFPFNRLSSTFFTIQSFCTHHRWLLSFQEIGNNFSCKPQLTPSWVATKSFLKYLCYGYSWATNVYLSIIKAIKIMESPAMHTKELFAQFLFFQCRFQDRFPCNLTVHTACNLQSLSSRGLK